jgi:hypothetical protein
MTRSVLRRAAAVAAVALAAARPAAAQTVTARYPVACPAGPCSVRFDIANTTGAVLQLNSFQLTTGSAAFAFYPLGGAGALAAYRARDVSGDYADFGTLSNANRAVFINFLNTGLPFELAAGGQGYVELEVAGAPALTAGAYQFAAVRANGVQVTGTVGGVAVVPEPATVVLVAGGLAGLAAAARRRRAA